MYDKTSCRICKKQYASVRSVYHMPRCPARDAYKKELEEKLYGASSSTFSQELLDENDIVNNIIINFASNGKASLDQDDADKVVELVNAHLSAFDNDIEGFVNNLAKLMYSNNQDDSYNIVIHGMDESSTFIGKCIETRRVITVTKVPKSESTYQ